MTYYTSAGSRLESDPARESALFSVGLRTAAHQRGIIPACAGNRSGGAATNGTDPGHPCVCGEQATRRQLYGLLIESSLRVRGTAAGERLDIHAGIVIPACAGNSAQGMGRGISRPGHPCVCGEQTGRHPTEVAKAGSSLRVRGTEPKGLGDVRSHRVIPACAGNRLCDPGRRSCRSRHPCVCGEQASRRGECRRV